ncbi:MAG: ABC transporter substrate-binding protein [Leucobacter sp.]
MKKRTLALMSTALVAALALGGCTSETESASGESVSTLRIGALGNTSDNLDPLTVNGFADYIAVGHLYEMLVELRDGVPHFSLAQEITSNDDATEWTITLVEDATFSDGSPVTAQDVEYSLQLLADPEASPNYASFYQDIDPNGFEVIDDKTLMVSLTRPRGDFVTTVLAFASFVFPDGFDDWHNPVGSGPYTLVSYDAGQQIVLEARDDYRDGAPTLERLEVTVIDDPQTRMNALKSGEIDFATRVDPVIVQAEANNPEVVTHRGGEGDSQVMGFEMNVNQAPFDDPRVREAMKLAIDRDELVETIFLGEGYVGNDLVGLGLEGYNESIPQREHDPDRARDLFAEAGVTEVTIRTAEITPGLTRAAELYVEQLAEAGVTATLDPTDPAGYFSDFEVLLSTPLQVAYYINRDAGAYLGSFGGSTGFFNMSGYAPAEFDALLLQAQSTADPDARAELFDQAQQQSWDEGGTILWGYQPVLNANAPGLEGVYLSQGVPVFHEASFTR